MFYRDGHFIKNVSFVDMKKSYRFKIGEQSLYVDRWTVLLTVKHIKEAEGQLLVGGSRKRCLSILKTIRDRHLDLQVYTYSHYRMYSTFHKHGFHKGSFSTNLLVRDATRQTIILLCRPRLYEWDHVHSTVLDISIY